MASKRETSCRCSLRNNDTLHEAFDGKSVTPCGSLHIHNTEDNINELFMTITDVILDDMESPMVKPAGRCSGSKE